MASPFQKRNIPGVYLQVFDESLTISPSAALYVAGMLQSHVGQANTIIDVGNETSLVSEFGKPDDINYDDWFNIARVWKYKVGSLGATLKVVRPVGTGSINGGLTVTTTQAVVLSTPLKIDNRDKVNTVTVVFDAGSDATVGFLKFFAAYPTDVVYKIALCSPADFATAEVYTGVAFKDNFEVAPEGTEVAIAVLDSADNILEKWVVDVNPGGTDSYGFDNYIENVFNQKSKYIYAYRNAAVTSGKPFTIKATALVGGAYVAPTDADYTTALKLFENAELVDINYVIAHPLVHAETITLCENRQDCSFRASALKSDLVGAEKSVALAAIKTYATTTLSTNTSYGSFGAQAFLIFDSYNNKYRWIGCAGDLVGLRVRQNLSTQPWYSDAGLNYGQFMEVEKFAQYWDVNDVKTIIESRMNPIILKPGKGNVKWGQRNFTAKPSALRDEGVRELINSIWRASKTYLEYKLFEFNDDFTRGSITSQLNRFLKSVQDGRGIRRTDGGSDGYKVKCDSLNNPSDIVNQNILIVDVAFLPNRAIEEIAFRVTIAADELQLELL